MITRETTELGQRGSVAGTGGRGRSIVSLAVGHFDDVHHTASLPAFGSVTATVSSEVDGTYSFAGTANTYLCSPYTGSDTYATGRVSWLLRFTAIDASTTLTIHVLDSNYASLYSASVLGDFAVTDDHYWYTAYVDAGILESANTYYMALEVPSGTTIEVPYFGSAGSNLATATSGTPTSVVNGANAIFVPAEPYGKCSPITQLDGMEAELMVLDRRKR